MAVSQRRIGGVAPTSCTFFFRRETLFCITSAPPPCRRERPRGRSILASCTAQKHCPCTPGWTDLGCLQALSVLAKPPPQPHDFLGLLLVPRWAGCSSIDPAARSSGREQSWEEQHTGPSHLLHRCHCHCTVRAHCTRSSLGQARILVRCPLRWNPSRHSRCRDH